MLFQQNIAAIELFLQSIYFCNQFFVQLNFSAIDLFSNRFIAVVYCSSLLQQIKQNYSLRKMKKLFSQSLPRQYNLFEHNQLCCVCGMINCEEATDHTKIQLQDVRNALQKHISNEQTIKQIKDNITHFYQQIKQTILREIQIDEHHTKVYLNRFYFSKQFFDYHKINVDFIAKFMEKSIEQLPSKKIVKIVRKLQRTAKSQNNFEFEEIKQKSSKYLEEFNIQSLLSNLKESLPLYFLKQVESPFKLKSKTSISEITNPEQLDSLDKNKIYEWRNVRVSQTSRTVAFSNKGISDRQVMEQLPILTNYRNIQQFEIRNNKISNLTCNLIANNLPFLTSVDVRGNKINDKGIIKLINGLPKLKSFYISETLATDQSGKEVASKLPQLEMFWSEVTNISNLVALKIAQKPKLKVLSLLGNPIDDEYKEKMKKLFISKGYISV